MFVLPITTEIASESGTKPGVEPGPGFLDKYRNLAHSPAEVAPSLRVERTDNIARLMRDGKGNTAAI